jgi:hypothetical protein
MRGAAPLLVVLAAVLAAAGCSSGSVSLPPVSAAPAQEARVDWIEPTTRERPRLVFGVARIVVLRDGWRAEISIRNETETAWGVGTRLSPSRLPFGLMLFATGELDELTVRDREQSLPGIRYARTVQPAPPDILAPGESWTGTISAPGALAANRWLRVVFGPLVPEDDPPEGLPDPLVWITDHAYLLRGR